jgi:hypothetical protein
MGEIITLYMTSKLRQEIDSRRGDISRSKYLVKVVEKFHKENPQK